MDASAHLRVHDFSQRPNGIPVEEPGGLFFRNESGAGKAHAKTDAVGTFNPDRLVSGRGASRCLCGPFPGDGRSVHLDEAHRWNPAATVRKPAFLRPTMGDLHPFGRDFQLPQVLFRLKLRLNPTVALERDKEPGFGCIDLHIFGPVIWSDTATESA